MVTMLISVYTKVTRLGHMVGHHWWLYDGLWTIISGGNDEGDSTSEFTPNKRVKLL